MAVIDKDAVNKASQDKSQDVKGGNSAQKSESNSSQDAQTMNIADGLTKFYEHRCDFYEQAFLRVDEQAAQDVMGKFAIYDRGNREAVGGDFFGNLATKRQALNFGLLPSHFLPEAVDVAEVVA